MNLSGLLPYQGPAAEQLLASLTKHGAALDSSDMGTGKTFVAGAVIRELDLPTLVVGPKISESAWRKMGAHMGVTFSYCNYELIRTGRTLFGEWENPKPAKMPVLWVCDSCQMKLDPLAKVMSKCPHHNLGIHCVAIKRPSHNYGKFIWNPAIKQLVFDEVHRCAALDSLQSDMLLASRRQHIPTLSLSATAADSPLDFRALGFSLGLHNYANFYSWAAKHGCRKTSWGGFQFLLGESNRKRVMAELHQEIFPEHGARIRIEALGDAFPEVQIKAELYDLSEGGRINKLYAEMDEALAVLNGLRQLDGNAQHPLTNLLRARQELEIIKIPIFEELARDAIASGYHVAIFVNFRQTVDELCKRFKTNCRVDGSQVGERGARERQGCIADFQRDAEPVIIASAAAGSESISLHDTHGNFPRLGLVSLGYSSRQVRQIFGRLRRALAKSAALYRIVLAAGTCEEKIHKAIAGNLDQMDLLNDGMLMAANIPLTRHSVSEIFRDNADAA